MKVRRATADDVPDLVRFFAELDRMQREWRVFTPRPGFYDEVGSKYRAAIADEDQIVLVAEDDGATVGMAYAEARTPSRFSDERALELSGVVVRSDFRGRGVGRALVAEAAPVRHRTRHPLGGAEDLLAEPGRHRSSGRGSGSPPGSCR